MTWARLPRRDASTGLLRSGPGVTGWQWLSLRRQSLSACNWFGAGDWSRGREAEGTGLEYQRTQARSVRSNRTDSTRGRPSLAVTARAHCLFSRSKNRRHFGKTEKVSAGHISALASGSRPQIRLLARRPGESGKCQACREARESERCVLRKTPRRG